jgi:hypothetical protein
VRQLCSLTLHQCLLSLSLFLSPPTLSLSFSLLSQDLPAEVCAAAGGLGEGQGCGAGCLVSSFSLPPPSADASGAQPAPTPAFAIGSGKRWLVLACCCCCCCSISRGAATLRPSPPLPRRSPAQPRAPGLPGESPLVGTVAAHPPGRPLQTYRVQWGCARPARWVPWVPEPRGSRGGCLEFSLGSGIIHIWKTAEPAAGRAGRARPTGMQEL